MQLRDAEFAEYYKAYQITTAADQPELMLPEKDRLRIGKKKTFNLVPLPNSHCFGDEAAMDQHLEVDTNIMVSSGLTDYFFFRDHSRWGPCWRHERSDACSCRILFGSRPYSNSFTQWIPRSVPTYD